MLCESSHPKSRSTIHTVLKNKRTPFWLPRCWCQWRHFSLTSNFNTTGDNSSNRSSALIVRWAAPLRNWLRVLSGTTLRDAVYTWNLSTPDPMRASLSLGQRTRAWVWLIAQLIDCSSSYLQSVNTLVDSTYLVTVGWHGPCSQWASYHPDIFSYATTCRNPLLFQNATGARYMPPSACNVAIIFVSVLVLSTDNFVTKFVNGVRVSFLQKHN